MLEKAGVNVSIVDGVLSEAFRARIPGAADDGRFWASGISVVVHPRSPLVPAAHMNTRMIVTSRRWFGGGADLTPVFPVAEDTATFHGALRAACDAADPAYWPRFKAWCDEYFWLPHRGEPRGVGGIFFDDLAGADARGRLRLRPRRRPRLPASLSGDRPPAHGRGRGRAEQKRAQLIKRGRYVEFNLLWDRGTRFGIETGGNAEAVLMSLPPEVAWP